MSHVAIAAVSGERCLQGNMPHEILYEIFRRLPKDKLVGISKLCSKFRDVAGDTRLWNNVYIKYRLDENLTHESFYFEELYCEPWPIKTLDLSRTKVSPRLWKPNALQETKQIGSQISPVVSVFKLNLSSIRAPKITMEAILARYQCTELHLEHNSYCNIMEIAPEVFSKQTALKMLSLRGFRFLSDCQQWLASILKYCKNLKTLDLNGNHWLLVKTELSFIKSFPASLEKLSLAGPSPGDSFFELLSEQIPNLRELELFGVTVQKCPSLVKFQFLEALHIYIHCSPFPDQDLSVHLIRFPALKTVYIGHHPLRSTWIIHELDLKKYRRMLEPHGIIVKPIGKPKEPNLEDSNFWLVSKTM